MHYQYYLHLDYCLGIESLIMIIIEDKKSITNTPSKKGFVQNRVLHTSEIELQASIKTNSDVQIVTQAIRTSLQ